MSDAVEGDAITVRGSSFPSIWMSTVRQRTLTSRECELDHLDPFGKKCGASSSRITSSSFSSTPEKSSLLMSGSSPKTGTGISSQ